MIRSEINTRSAFAKSEGERWFKRMINSQKIGNVVSCHATRKFIQANKIYVHYNNEFLKSL